MTPNSTAADWVDQVGNEFSQVEGLWSQIENYMAKEPVHEESKDAKEGAAEESAR